MDRRIDRRTVREVMTRTPTTVRADTDVRTLKTMFEALDFNAFPVVDEEQRLVGVVTKLDVLRMFRPDRRRWIPDLRAVWGEHVGDIMTRAPVTVTPEDSIATAIDRMVQERLRSLPVVERRDGQDVVVGMISRGDVLQCLILEDDAAG